MRLVSGSEEILQMAMNSDEFTRRFLTGKIDLEPDRVDSKDLGISGILIKSYPIFKGAAKRLKTVVRRYQGDTPLYLQINDDEPIKVGGFNLTYDSLKAIDRVIKMYHPSYYIVDGDEHHELNERMLYDTVRLPKVEDRDLYL